MNDRIKEKIEKLLNMAMSDSEHEAKLAMKLAVEMMSKHNITKDQIYKQEFIVKEITTSYKRLPSWVVDLYNKMAYVSGCTFIWKNANFFHKYAIAMIVGRERDVENTLYLVAFLEREINKRVKEYKKSIQNAYGDKGYKTILVKSFKTGIIDTIFLQLCNQYKDFFSKQTRGDELVPVDTRVKEAKDYFLNLGEDINETKSTAKYDKDAYMRGNEEAQDINANQAVAKQDCINLLESRG